MRFDIQGPYEQASNVFSLTSNPDETLKSAIETWRNGEDKWGRGRRVIVSIGGEAGSNLPQVSTSSASTITNIVLAFIEAYGLDGIDVDVEGDHDRSVLVPMLEKLRSDNSMIVTSAPQADDPEIGNYMSQGILQLCDFIGLQMYNNGCGQLNYEMWHDGWSDVATPARWDSQDTTYQNVQGWMAGLWAAPATSTRMQSAKPFGVLAPASSECAGTTGGNPWKFEHLRDGLIEMWKSGVINVYVGTWAIGCDVKLGQTGTYTFSKAITDALVQAWSKPHSPTPPHTPPISSPPPSPPNAPIDSRCTTQCIISCPCHGCLYLSTGQCYTQTESQCQPFIASGISVYCA